MDNVIWGRIPRHCAASAGLKKASIGTVPPDTSLKRLARPRDASFRPAKMLRRCAAEHSAASASWSTVIPLASAQRSMRCGSDMAATISPRNDKSQYKIFPPEIALPIRDLLQCDMKKHTGGQELEIHLGDWLAFFDLGPSEAAKIAGCTQGYISNIVRGEKTNINVLYLLKLSEHLEVNINDFYRPLPSKTQLDALKKLSPRAQATILARKQQKG